MSSRAKGLWHLLKHLLTEHWRRRVHKSLRHLMQLSLLISREGIVHSTSAIRRLNEANVSSRSCHECWRQNLALVRRRRREGLLLLLGLITTLVLRNRLAELKVFYGKLFILGE